MQKKTDRDMQITEKFIALRSQNIKQAEAIAQITKEMGLTLEYDTILCIIKKTKRLMRGQEQKSI